MALAAGQRLGPYEILSLIGAGGMGEVYRARDTRLNRSVALKILPSDMAGDPERRARFEREAQAIAALNHPHICTLHDIGEAGGTTYLVMEHLAGETLAERLERGPLSLGQALDIGAQIADGLAAAHRAGVIHRDLKPANVMLVAEGRRTLVKLLDFGLAKLRGHGEEPAIARASETTALVTLTGRGTIVGTLPYMAPEQVQGQEADARTDVWALGALLYEMITGTRPFDAPSAVSLAGVILERDPAPLASRQPLAPPALERVVRRCLAKHQDDRWAGAQDLAEELRGIAEDAVLPHTAPATARARRHWWWLAGAVCVVLLVVSGLVLLRPRIGHELESSLTSMRITAQPAEDPVRTSCLSPDGKFLAYSARAGVHIRVIASGQTQRVPKTEGMEVFGWSADGTSIRAARLNGQTYTAWDIPLVTAPPRRAGTEWSANDLMAFSRGSTGVARATPTGEIWVRMNGAPERKVAQAGQKGAVVPVSALTWSADGQRLFFGVGSGIHMMAVSNGVTTQVATQPGYVLGLAQLPDGRLIIASETTEGGGGQLLQLRLSPSTGIAAGQIVRLLPLTDSSAEQLSISDDGRHLAYLNVRRQSDVYIADLDTARRQLGPLHRLTMDERNDRPLAWVPDGSAVLFYSDRNGSLDIFKQSIGSDVAEPLVTGPGDQYLPRVTSDGKWVLFVEAGTNGSFRVMRVPLEGGAPEHVLSNPGYAAPRCAVRGPCVLLERQGEIMAVFALDTVAGKGRELTRFPASDFGANVSATGDEFAFVVPDPSPRRRIRVVSFRGGAPRDIVVREAHSLQNLDWLPDGSGFLTMNRTPMRSDLLLVDFNGDSQVLWSGDGRPSFWALPSPDGTRVALHVMTRQSDVWMLRMF